MARITVEDCMNEIDNIFDMILLASIRAKIIANGAVGFGNIDIADGKMSENILKEMDAMASQELIQEEDESDDIMPLQSLSIGR